VFDVLPKDTWVRDDKISLMYAPIPLVRIHCIIVMIRWTGLSLNSLFQVRGHLARAHPRVRRARVGLHPTPSTQHPSPYTLHPKL